MTRPGTKANIIETARAIAAKYSEGSIITDSDDSNFIFNTMIANHPAKEEKIGCGIQFIRVDINLVKKKCFTIIRTDGSETSLGIYASANAKNIDSNILIAAREAIKPSIRAYRTSRQHTYHCDTCNKKLDDTDNNNYSQVHHNDPDFDKIYRTWKRKQTMTLKLLDLTTRKNCELNGPHALPQFISSETINDFIELHDKLCCLSLLCVNCHNKTKRKKGGRNNTTTASITEPPV